MLTAIVYEVAFGHVRDTSFRECLFGKKAVSDVHRVYSYTVIATHCIKELRFGFTEEIRSCVIAIDDSLYLVRTFSKEQISSKTPISYQHQG